MFAKLFRSQAVVQRHLRSPLLQARLEYLQYCANQGYSPITLRGLAADLLLIQNLLGLATSSDSLGPAAIQAGVNRWVDRRPRHFKHKNGRRGHEQLFSRAVRWLRFLGHLQIPGEVPPAYGSLLEPYADYLRMEKGLSEGTIRTRHWYVEDFLGWFFQGHNSLRQITIADLDEAIARKGRDDGYARLSVRAYASSLRSFFRYAESRGWCTRGLAALVASPRVSARKPTRGSILERCATPCHRRRRIPAQGYSGPRHFAPPYRLRPTFRRSMCSKAGRFGLGKGLAFRPAHQRTKTRALSPLSHRRPRHHPLSQRSASSVSVSRSLSVGWGAHPAPETKFPLDNRRKTDAFSGSSREAARTACASSRQCYTSAGARVLPKRDW